MMRPFRKPSKSMLQAMMILVDVVQHDKIEANLDFSKVERVGVPPVPRYVYVLPIQKWKGHTGDAVLLKSRKQAEAGENCLTERGCQRTESIKAVDVLSSKVGRTPC